VLQYGAEWTDGVKLNPIGSDLVPMGSDWVISHTHQNPYRVPNVKRYIHGGRVPNIKPCIHGRRVRNCKNCVHGRRVVNACLWVITQTQQQTRYSFI